MEKLGIPEINSLDSMEGVETPTGFEKKKDNYVFTSAVRNAVKSELGAFDFFDKDFFSTIYTEKERLGDPLKGNVQQGEFYISLDIFERLMEKGLLDEKDEETFCFAFVTSHYDQKEIARYLRNKTHTQGQMEPNQEALKRLVDNYLPNIKKLLNVPNIEEIDYLIRERCFKFKLAADFLFNGIMPTYKVSSAEDWEKDKFHLLNEFLEKRQASGVYPQHLLNGFPGLDNYAGHLGIEETIEISEDKPMTVTVNWRDVLGHGLKTLGVEDLDFYSLVRLNEVLSEIKDKYNF